MLSSKKHWLGFYGVFFVISFFLFIEYQKISTPSLRVVFFDVGQGDSTLITTPNNQKFLIDTGLSGNLVQKLKNHFSFFGKTIDLLVLTHPDLDHTGDTFQVLENFKIKQVLLPFNAKQTPLFLNLIDVFQAHKIPLAFANHQNDLQIGKTTYLDILYPELDSSFQEFNQLSNASLVFKLVYGKNTLFFSGDAEKKEEKKILLSSQNLQADFYQVGHHGSKTSSSTEFVQAIRPQISIISVDAYNQFGHPHQEVLQTLVPSRVLQTALNGNLYFTFNEKDFW